LWLAHEGNISGANIALLEYLDVLENQFDFWVVLPHEGSMILALEKRNIPFSIIYQYGWTKTFPSRKFLKWPKVLLRSLIAIWQTKRLIRKFNASIVCTNTLVPFTASVAAKQLGVPHVWWIHEFGKEDFGFEIGWGHEKSAFQWMQSSSKLIITNSKAISSKFSNLMPMAKIETIYQPVSLNETKKNDVVKKARFIMFGQIVASKGHKMVLDAILAGKEMGKKIPTLHILGPSEDSNYLNDLEEFLLKNELSDYVKIEIGFFEKEIVLPQYEILIVASQSEAFGRVIIEANKAGLHVLVRNCGGAPELINESNGLLFNNQDELISVLNGEKDFNSNIEIRMNYDESLEIEKLIKMLHQVCH